MEDINKSINIIISLVNKTTKNANSIISSFDKIVKKSNDVISSIDKINKSLNDLKATNDIKNLAKIINSISLKKDNISNISKFVKELGKLDNTKLPSFTSLNQDLEKHEKIIKSVTTSYREMNSILSKLKLKNVVSESNSASKATSNLNAKLKKSGTTFSQVGFAIGSASTGLSKFGTRIYGVTRGFSAISKEMGLAMTAFTTAFTSLFALKGVITDIAKFDDAIRAAGAVAQASSTQLTQLSDAARAMGESTRYTATDAADALKALAMTGFDVEESIATLPTVLNLAAAANMSLGQSADIVTNIMVGYGKTIEDLPKIADYMTAAFTNANTSLSEIGVALKYVGPVANAAGQSLEETTGILASLANAGYRGSKAGVILRTSIANILAPTEKMKEVLRDYDIALTDLTNPDGTMKSFTSILEIMTSKGITAGDALTLFGKRAGPGVLALMEQGLPALEEMNSKIAESEGTSLKAAYEMEAGLGGALRRLKSMWDEVSIAIGKVIEKDVEKFVSNLTKSLNDNKEQIVDFVSGLFNIFNVLAKVASGIATFVVEHIKLVTAIAAISSAIKLLTASSKGFMAIGIIKHFSMMYSSVKWSGISSGILGLAKGLDSYTKASKSASAVGAVSSLTNLKSFKFSSIFNGIKSIGSAFLTLGASAAKAAIALVAANPVIAGIAGAAAAAYAAIKIFSENHEEAAKSSLKLAKATKESNRELEYQIAELKLINNEFGRKNVKDYSNAEQRLYDVIKKANIPLEEKIKLQQKVSEGSEQAKKAISELTDKIKEEKSANDVKLISNVAKAREAQTKAVEAQAKKLEYYYGIQIDGQTRLNALESAQSKTNVAAPIIWLKKKLGIIDKNIEKYEELKAQQKDIDKNYEEMLATMIVSGKSVDEFQAALEKSGASADTVKNVTKSFTSLKDEAEKNNEVMKKLKGISESSLEAIEVSTKRQIEIYKEANAQREGIQKQTMYNLSVLEAKGQIDHETAEMAKLQATLNSTEQQVQAAKELYSSIDELSVEGREQAMAEITKAEEKAATVKLQILEKISSAEEKLNEKISSLGVKRAEESERNETKISELRDNYNKKHENLEIQKTEKIQEINEKLSQKIESIEQKLSEKRSELQDKRVQEALSSAQKIAGIESSTEDKIRAIKQKGMTDDEKNTDNREAAAKKLKEGEELIAKAKADGDQAALERGTKLVEQASELYSGLKDEEEAISGVTEASDKLKEAEKVRSENALKDIDEKIKAQEAAAEKERKIAEEAAQRDTEKAEVGYDKKIKEAEEFYNLELQKEEESHTKKIANIDAEISKFNDKLSIIQNEKDLVLGLIEQYKQIESFDGGSSAWEAANTATQEAVEKVNEYTNAIGSLSDHEVNLKFTGEASPKAPLGDKLNEITNKISEINSEIEVNVKFKSEGEDLSSGVKKIQEDIESLDITVPVNADIQELEAVINIVERYKDIGININIKVNSGELNNVAEIINGLVNKAVAITTKIIGYDDLVKAKNMIESIKSKTVTITTKHRSVSEKAAGGYIKPEKYATGGNVFRRLSSPYISKGGGKKDDVPAMLMKGEFVQKVSAVKKYGKDFMAKLNAGLIPKSVTRMFNSGGEVYPIQPEYYASGGHVGYKDLPKKYRKKILDLLNQKVSDINTNLNDSNITTEMGESSINRMTNAFSESVSKFVNGGSISQATANINKERNEIMKQYDDLIKQEEISGNIKTSETIKKEQISLNEVSKKLQEELVNIKKEYEEYLNETTESYEQENKESEKQHNENLSEIDNNYNNSVEETKNEKEDEDNKDNEEYNKQKQEYENELSQIDSNFEKIENEIYGDLLNSKTNLSKSVEEIHKFGKLVADLYNEAKMWEDIPEEEVKGAVAGVEKFTGGESPDAKYTKRDIPIEKEIEIMIKTMSDEEVRGHTKDELSDKLENLWNDYELARKSFIDVGINPDNMLRKSKIEDLKKYANTIANSRKKESVNESNEKFKIVKNEYNEKMNEREFNYNNTLNELNSTKKEDIKKENMSYESEKLQKKENYDNLINDAKIKYNEDVKNETESANKESEEIRKSSKEEIASIRNEVIVNIENLEQERNNDLNSLKESQKEEQKNISEIKDVSRPESQKSVFDFMKKKLKIFGFNSGGFVNSTSDSIPGKDSILSALTPNEYVIKASVVRRFGKGFFDSLNNFKIPMFNMGGIVGDDVKTTSTSTTRYALDLNINGSQQGELTGSKMTIQNIINELSLAQLSAR